MVSKGFFRRKLANLWACAEIRRASMNCSVLMFLSGVHRLVGGAERQAEKLGVALAEVICRMPILMPRLYTNSPDSERIDQRTIERSPFTDSSRRYPVRGVAVLNIPYIVWQIAQAVWPRRTKGADVLHCHLASRWNPLGHQLAANSVMRAEPFKSFLQVDSR